MPPSICAADIIISIGKEPFFSFKMQSKYTLKRMNYDMFPKKIPRAITIPHSKRVAIIIIVYIKIY